MPSVPTIENMQQHAAQHGGKCLSKEYWDDICRLMWMCEKGHVWELPWRFIKQGAWCPVCAKAQLTKDEYLKELKEIAQGRGGRLLTEQYINGKTKMLWECAKGHQWETTGSSIKNNKSWCPHCVGMHHTLEEVQAIAASRGGKLLSEKFINSTTKLKWQCSKGHEWEIEPYKVIHQGRWCPKCGKERGAEKITLDIGVYHKIAEERGGKLLINENKKVTNKTKLLWQCREGHQWYCTPGSIKINKSWCPYCYGTVRKTIHDMHEIAAKKGGYCLSTEIVNTKTKLVWKCSKGHIWKATPDSVLKRNWCPVCGNESRSAKQRKDIEIYRKIAAERGGKLLSTVYINSELPLLWECKNGHQWEASGGSISNNKTWCPYCAGKMRKTIQDMQEMAAKKGGKCLSSEYTTNKQKLEWQCSEGHVWKTRSNAITSGNWCPYCAGRIKKTIQYMHDIAAKHGGKCLSEEYHDSKTKLEWQCSEGHIWQAIYENSNDRWCPVCYKISRNNKT